MKNLDCADRERKQSFVWSVRCFGSPVSRRDADPFDLPFKFDAGLLLDLFAHRLTEHLNLRAGCVAAIDQKITMHLRNLGAAVLQAAAASGIDQFPGFAAP